MSSIERLSLISRIHLSLLYQFLVYQWSVPWKPDYQSTLLISAYPSVFQATNPYDFADVCCHASQHRLRVSDICLGDLHQQMNVIYCPSGHSTKSPCRREAPVPTLQVHCFLSLEQLPLMRPIHRRDSPFMTDEGQKLTVVKGLALEPCLWASISTSQNSYNNNKDQTGTPCLPLSGTFHPNAFASCKSSP